MHAYSRQVCRCHSACPTLWQWAGPLLKQHLPPHDYGMSQWWAAGRGAHPPASFHVTFLDISRQLDLFAGAASCRVFIKHLVFVIRSEETATVQSFPQRYKSCAPRILLHIACEPGQVLLHARHRQFWPCRNIFRFEMTFDALPPHSVSLPFCNCCGLPPRGGSCRYCSTMSLATFGAFYLHGRCNYCMVTECMMTCCPLKSGRCSFSLLRPYLPSWFYSLSRGLTCCIPVSDDSREH